MHCLPDARTAHHGRPRSRILTGTPAVRNLIRQNKSYQLISTMQTSRNQGMMLMDDSLGELVRSGEVRLDDAAAKAADPEAFPQSVFR